MTTLKIQAHDCTVATVSAEALDDFLKLNNEMPLSYSSVLFRVGLFYKEELIGIAVWGVPPLLKRQKTTLESS